MDSAAESKNDMNIDFSDSDQEDEDEDISRDSDRIRIPSFNENKGHKVIISSEDESVRSKNSNIEDISRSYEDSEEIASSSGT